jgi:hypothetical protein
LSRRPGSSGLLEAALLVDQHHAARRETLTAMARLVADLPKLKAAMATGDPLTVEPLALDYRARVRSDVFVAVNRHGRSLAALGARGLCRGKRCGRWPAARRFRSVEGPRLLEVVVPVTISQAAEVPV